HIECSAMSMKYLGESFDIHTGGQDHVQIHHTNEIAQSEAATGKPFVRYWLHGAWLLFKGRKISKSIGGLYTISELEGLGFEPMDFRYLCLTTHYRKPLSFTIDNLKTARNSYQRLENIISELKDDKKINGKYLEDFKTAINDDLDMPGALRVLWDLVRNKNAKGKLRTIKEMDRILGLDLLKKKKIVIPQKIKKLIEQREKFRKAGNFKEADEIRKKINNLGFIIEDTEKGAVVKKR
ncbi:MAG TPA: cysteine--tRNA ligase, partial [Candidatus Nanoarchaeia archaeon]|nr:cysteine--tRNA ligase [Candidatus Nanoarchaeia archaeon]